MLKMTPDIQLYKRYDELEIMGQNYILSISETSENFRVFLSISGEKTLKISAFYHDGKA